ncbi:ABC transporter permease [Enterocloster citroniae]|uniref:ABC transporter permease n=1 Tax=Enterocloster citroniae TaxID=358743 RepID=UPI0008E56BC2|nr:ABC transporter permease [Enterocloster citroniae]SFS22911.1 peptide/nickel transport system permease protein [Enterocloster citroniae]
MENPAKKYTNKKEFYRQFKKKSNAYELWLRFMKNKTALLGLFIFCAIVLLAIGAPLLASYENDVIRLDVANRLQSPGNGHLLGTDEMGRDIFARLVFGARISLVVGISSVAVALLIGGTLGAISGFYGGIIDSVIMRIMDVFLCLPDVLLALAIIATFGVSKVNLVISIGLSFTPKFSRIVRSAVLGVRGSEYIEAARSIGAKDGHIILHHALVNCMGPIIVQVTLYVASAILTISGLSFLGLGIQAPAPEWGNMLASGRAFMRDEAYIVMAPGLAIFFTILSLNLLGDGLRDTLDPRLKH